MTVVTKRGAVDVAGPDEVVGVDGVEVEDLEAERIGWVGSFEFVPGASAVGRVMVSLRVGDEVGAVWGEGVVIECQEVCAREKLVPGVAFIAGLPH